MSEQNKQEHYLAIVKQLVDLVGGKDNIVASTHCATRLRIVLKDYDKADRDKIEDVDLVKGQFVAGNQLQIIFGAGLVNEIYEVFAQYTGTGSGSMAEVKQAAAARMNPCLLYKYRCSGAFPPSAARSFRSTGFPARKHFCTPTRCV